MQCLLSANRRVSDKCARLPGSPPSRYASRRPARGPHHDRFEKRYRHPPGTRDAGRDGGSRGRRRRDGRGSERQPPGGDGGGAHGTRGGGPRGERHPGQPPRDARSLRAGRRVRDRQRSPHLQVRGRGRGGARQHPAAAGRLRARRHPGSRLRGGGAEASRRRSLRAHPPALPGEHPLGQGAAARLPRSGPGTSRAGTASACTSTAPGCSMRQ